MRPDCWSLGCVLQRELLRNDSGQGMTVKSGHRPRCHRRLSTLGHQKLVPVSLRSQGGRSWGSAVLPFYLCTSTFFNAVPKSTTALINVVSQGNRGRFVKEKNTELGKGICFSDVLSLMTVIYIAPVSLERQSGRKTLSG